MKHSTTLIIAAIISLVAIGGVVAYQKGYFVFEQVHDPFGAPIATPAKATP